MQGRWSDHAITILLENLRPKESLWNLKVEAYGNISKKKSDIEEILEEVANGRFPIWTPSPKLSRD